MKQRTLFAVAGLLMLILAGCAKGDQAAGIGKKPGMGRGVISNLDPLNNGLGQVWIFGDNTYVYCTLDTKLIQDVANIMNLEGDVTVFYTYRDWKAGDPELESFDNAGDRISSSCGQFVKGSIGGKLLSVELVNQRPQ